MGADNVDRFDYGKQKNCYRGKAFPLSLPVLFVVFFGNTHDLQGAITMRSTTHSKARC
jgi:hypothetical protein